MNSKYLTIISSYDQTALAVKAVITTNDVTVFKAKHIFSKAVTHQQKNKPSEKFPGEGYPPRQTRVARGPPPVTGP